MGLAGGLIFLGIGLGVVGSGTVLPLILRTGVTQAWLVLAASGFALTALAWFFLPADKPGSAIGATTAAPISPALWALFAAYAASAIGQVPAILFLADFVARGLGEGVAAGAWIWAVFGLGALSGPLAAGFDRRSHRLRGGFARLMGHPNPGRAQPRLLADSPQRANFQFPAGRRRARPGRAGSRAFPGAMRARSRCTAPRLEFCDDGLCARSGDGRLRPFLRLRPHGPVTMRSTPPARFSCWPVSSPARQAG